MIFRIAQQDGSARCGELTLPHGAVLTPAFMPVGTNATVKAASVESLQDLGVNLLLSNTYHLYLRPGIDVIEAAGGLHKFMAWKHNILTDSGGFQIFSLAPFRKIDDDGVQFRSHIDGSRHSLSPEGVIEAQFQLGSDVMMPLDVCTPFGISRQEAEEAVKKTCKWAHKSLVAWRRLRDECRGVLFAIVQGNFYRDLREICSEQLADMDFPGYAIGGLSVGENFSLFREFLAISAPLLPVHKPRYLMGIGTPDYILEAVGNGIDLFDCVYPTRIARNAMAFTPAGNLSLRWARNKFDMRPIDAECRCHTCRNYTRAYLRHLFKAREIMAAVLTTHHNLAFIQNLISSIRTAIGDGDFLRFKREFLARFEQEKA